MKILGISGSLRARSTNTALLGAAFELAPTGVVFETAAIGSLPHYNDDLDAASVAAVQRLREQITEADGVLIVTPEYNYSIPGPLKNALDWASRPAYKSPFHQKPVGLMGASGGLAGTARAQGHLKQILLGMAAQVFPFAEVLVNQSAKKFDEQLRLSDEDTRQIVARYMSAYTSWVTKVG